MIMNTKTKTDRLALGGLLVALSTVLSVFVKAFELPYGGSVTLCSMLPVMLYAYICGTKWGLGAAFTFSVLQLLFGLNALKGISAAAVIGSIILDYFLAFTVLGLAGIFRGRIKNDAGAFTVGCVMCCLLRYLSSFLSGWILWAQFMEVADMQAMVAQFFPGLASMSGNGLSAMYSLVYNGLYMVPETVLTCVVAFLLMQFAGKALLKLGDGFSKKTA